MKWHEHPIFWKACAAAKGWKINSGNQEEYCKQLMNIMVNVKNRDKGGFNTAAQVYAEYKWGIEKRPYYDLYPSVANAFMKVDLSKIKCEQVHLPLPRLMVRFQVGHELEASEATKVRSFLVAHAPAAKTAMQPGGRGLIVMINDGLVDTMVNGEAPIPIHTVNAVELREGSTIEDHLADGRAYPYTSDKIDDVAVDNVYRLIVALCLLKGNPDLIEPEPLEADKEKWEKNHDPQLLVKAENRGKRCWSVGKHIEVAPGFRRPHFAIRWCGKGGTDPQLRPIKGCLVRRKVIEEVPTGYLDVPLEAILLDD